MSIKDDLEDVGNAWEWWQRQVIRFSMICGLGVGVLFFKGPDQLREELPYHKEIGIGIFAFSLVFLIALSGKGGIASRAKNLLLGVCLSGIGGLMAVSTFVSFSKGEADVKTWGLGIFGVFVALYGLNRLWAMLTGAAAPDEEG